MEEKKNAGTSTWGVFDKIVIKEAEGEKKLFVHGKQYMSWPIEDQISHRIAIVQLYKTGIAEQEELSKIFNVLYHINQKKTKTQVQKCAICKAESISTPEDYLSIVPKISTFQFIYDVPRTSKLLFNCEYDGMRVQAIPNIENQLDRRKVAIEFNKKYSESGKYCVNTNIETIEQLTDRKEIVVYFEDLKYDKEMSPEQATAKLEKDSIEFYRIEGYITQDSSAEKIQEILKEYDKKLSGKKDEVVQRYIELATEEYNKREKDIAKYFTNRKYIKTEINVFDTQEFKVLENNTLKNLMLSIFIMKHLRANTVLDARHENDTCTTSDIVKALISRNISLTGWVFLKVE